jgi:hypothetical protein
MRADLIVDHERRSALAGFLERLAKGEADPQEWQHFAVAHYGDEALERVRRDCVRFCIQTSEHSWSEAEVDQIHAWARELRGTPG